MGKDIITRISSFIISQKTLYSLKLLIVKILRAMRFDIVWYLTPQRIPIIDLINKIKYKDKRMNLTNTDAYILYNVVKSTYNIEGDIAEVGVYTGGSARIICEAKQDKMLHLFDTFKGLPKTTSIDYLFREGQFKGDIEDVKNYLKNYQGVYFYKGLFEETCTYIKDKKFSCVHIDVDLYESTKNCLEFFHERMSRGGIIVIHDYPHVEGVKKAVDEFFRDKEDIVIEMPSLQCLIIKI